MATELTVQSERAFQKQPHIFVNSKAKRAKSTRAGKGGRRWFKDVGLGFRTPKTAIEGTYIGALWQCCEIQLLSDHVQIRNVPSPARFLSVAAFLRAPWSQPKCIERSSSAANISTLFPNTHDMRSDIRTWPRTYHRHSVWRRGIKSLLGSVGH